MKRVAWLTDIHLNFLERQQLLAFLREVFLAQPDAVLISGDIGEANSLIGYLQLLEAAWPCPVYFVLGNHDYYRGAFWSVQADVSAFVEQSPRMVWLREAGIVELAAGVGLVGHDSWADGRCGDYAHSGVMLNDYVVIDELTALSKTRRLEKLHQLGDEAAAYFAGVLPRALAAYPHVILLTHVPPFCESAWHEGRVSSDEFLPHFACKAAGDALREVMLGHPERRLTVLCGHTHGQGAVQILDNLLVLTGGAVYGAPEIQRIFQLT